MYKILIFMFIFFEIFIFKLNDVSARNLNASFFGCDEIACDIKTGGVVSINFNTGSEISLPKCNYDNFLGWAVYVGKDNDDKNYVFCGGNEFYLDNGTVPQKCLFNGMFSIKHEEYSFIQFEAVYQNGYPKGVSNISSACSTSSSGNISNSGTDEGNYDEGNIVSCGPNLLKDIPGILPSTIHIIYLVLQLAVPIILVILGIIDFIKSMVNSKEDEIKKGQKTFISRIIAGVLIFFVFSIVKLVISLVADNSTKILNCAECFISDNDKCIR